MTVKAEDENAKLMKTVKSIVLILLFVMQGGTFSVLWGQSIQIFLGADGKHLGLMNLAYEIVVPAQYSSLVAEKNRFWAHKGPEQRGLIDQKGKELIPLEYQKIEHWRGDSLFKVQKNGRWGVINVQSGQMIFELQFKSIYWPNKEGIAVARAANGLQGLIKINGAILLKPTYKHIRWESHGFRVVQNQQGKYGFLNTQGKLVIPCRYDDALNFQGQFSKVAIGKQWYYINRYGVLVNKTKSPAPREIIEVPEENFFIVTNIARPQLRGLKGRYKTMWKQEDVQQNLLTYVRAHQHLPRIVEGKSIQGELQIQFIVSESGRLRDIKVLQGLDRRLDRHTVSLLKRLREWSPASCRGKKIPSLHVVNIPYSYR